MVIGHVDGDILVYEIGFAAEASWKYWHAEEGDYDAGHPPFDYVYDMMTARIGNIIATAEVDQPIYYLTGKQNFRNFIAKTTPYKERAGNKPFH